MEIDTDSENSLLIWISKFKNVSFELRNPSQKTIFIGFSKAIFNQSTNLK